MGQHTNFRSILEHSGKNWTFVVHTNFQVEISDDTRIFSRRTQDLFWSKNQLSDKISQTLFSNLKEMTRRSQSVTNLIVSKKEDSFVTQV